jgi:hypothetical protein
MGGIGTLALAAALAAGGGAHDFDFWMGSWKIHNRRLRERLRGSTVWDEFEARCTARPTLNGLGNEDEYRTDYWPDFVGMSFRFFDPATKKWSIYWADSRRGVLDPPVVGAFAGATGVFEGSDTFEGRPIRVRFTWSGVATPQPRWEQAFSDDAGKTWETNWTMEMTRDDRPAAAFPIVELRRYTLQPGQREAFVNQFESFFPEAFQQLGALALGQFAERGKPDAFTWLRGFPDLDARARVSEAFYAGPLWKEQRTAANARIVDSDDVLLLHPLRPDTGIPALPALDPVAEPQGAGGVVVAQLFAVKPGQVEAFTLAAEAIFASYREAGAREAGLLVSLDVPNNYPRLPIRSDGPYLLWLGILADDASLRRFEPLAARGTAGLAATGLLRAEPERIVLDPTRRSRLRATR